jgi:hypothetical protein
VLKTSGLQFKAPADKSSREIPTEFVVGADGAFSKVFIIVIIFNITIIIMSTIRNSNISLLFLKPGSLSP